MTDIISHGTKYFQDKKIVCPECNSSMFSVSKLTGEISNLSKGIYELRCQVCDCEWQEVTKE